MKKLLLALFALVSISFSAQAQCTPDMQYAGDDGIHPDSAQGFAPAYVGTAYSQTITVVIPADTCVQIAPPPWPCSTLSFDSVIVTNVTGLPASFTFTCAPPNCRYLGNSIDCAVITGTAISSEVGTHDLTFYIDAYVGGFSTPNSYTIDYYKLVVMPANGVNENSPATGSTKVTPNPFSSQATIQFNSPASGNCTFEVYNVFGQVVQSRQINLTAGNNSFVLDGSNLAEGTYFYKITTGNQTITKKIIISR